MRAGHRRAQPRPDPQRSCGMSVTLSLSHSGTREPAPIRHSCQLLGPGHQGTHTPMKHAWGSIHELIMVSAVQSVMIGKKAPSALCVFGEGPCGSGQSPEGHRHPMLATKCTEPGRSLQPGTGVHGAWAGRHCDLCSHHVGQPVTSPSGTGHLSQTAIHEVGTGHIGPILQKRMWAEKLNQMPNIDQCQEGFPPAPPDCQLLATQQV